MKKYVLIWGIGMLLFPLHLEASEKPPHTNGGHKHNRTRAVSACPAGMRCPEAPPTAQEIFDYVTFVNKEAPADEAEHTAYERDAVQRLQVWMTNEFKVNSSAIPDVGAESHLCWPCLVAACPSPASCNNVQYNKCLSTACRPH